MNNSALILLLSSSIVASPPLTDDFWVETESGDQMITPDGADYNFVE